MKNKMTQATKYRIRLSTRFGVRRTVTDAGGMGTGRGGRWTRDGRRCVSGGVREGPWCGLEREGTAVKMLFL